MAKKKNKTAQRGAATTKNRGPEVDGAASSPEAADSTPSRGVEGRLVAGMVGALALAAAAAAYLLYAYVQKHLDPDFESICALSATFDCDKLNLSAWGKIGGVPITVFAIPTYGALAFLAWRSRAADAVGRGALLALLGGSALSVLYGAVLLFVMVSQEGVYCPFCLVMDAMMVATLTLAVLAWRRMGPGQTDLLPALARGTGVGLAVLVLPLGYHLSSLDSYEKQTVQQADEGVDLSEAAPALQLNAEGGGGERAKKIDEKNYYIPIQDDDAVYGPADAKVTIVEFADFQCGYCKKLFYSLKPIKEKYKGQSVRFVFKHFPMNTSCNSSIKNNRHRYACKASIAAECARRQDRFWPMHDLLFKNQHKLKEKDLAYYAGEVGLDMGAFGSCMRSPEALAAIRSDITTFDQTEISKGTPRTFINGRFFRGVLPQSTLEHIIEQELGRRAPGEKPQRAATAPPTTVKPTEAPAQVKVDYGRPYWIDSFEASVDASGRALSQVSASPANATWYEAKAACEKAGKRLCTTYEWVSACQSAAAVDDDQTASYADDYVEGNQFPYADWYEARWCRDSQEDKRDAAGKVTAQGSAGPTGEKPRCATPSGIFDLGGNVAEWAGATEDLAVLLGGDYRSKDKTGCFRPNSTFGPGHKNDRIGFRCCSDKPVGSTGAPIASVAPKSMLGRKLPPFSGKTLEGDDFDSSSLKGQVTYLSFYASWCSPCRREL
ncbi:MAG: thioredoxin domain-containing protein, partial [Myxococcota bacterium]|nr:thioredoxin domain-containing protein [Myxococcota bacterium]